MVDKGFGAESAAGVDRGSAARFLSRHVRRQPVRRFRVTGGDVETC